MSSSQREDLMDQVKQQIVIANTQELLTVRKKGHLSGSKIRRRLHSGWKNCIIYIFYINLIEIVVNGM